MRKIFLARLILLGVLVVLAFATIAGLVWLDALVDERREVAVTVRVLAEGGEPRFDGAVLAPEPEPVAALLAAGLAGGFDVAVSDGRVVSVAGEAGAWTFRVERGGGRVAAGEPLAAGDVVEWWLTHP